MNEFWVNMIGGIFLFVILFAIVYGCSIDILVATKSKKRQWIFVLVSLSIFALLILICGIQYNNQVSFTILLFCIFIGISLYILYRCYHTAKAISKEAERDFGEWVRSYTISLFLILFIFFIVVYAFREASISKEEQQHLQEALSYDDLQNHQTDDYQMIVLDGEEKKDIRYYSKKMRGYRYYRVKLDLSYEEVPVTDTAFLSNRRLQEEETE